MSAMSSVKAFLTSVPAGEPFSSNSLRQLATTENIRQILNRLVKSGELSRVARGVFVKPKSVANLGKVLPSATEIAKTLTESTGETIAIHGAEAARQLQLSTQVPLRLIFYTSGNSRTLRIANRTIKLKHVNPSQLIAPGTMPGLVISALAYLGKKNVTRHTLELIEKRISAKDFKATVQLMKSMPAWMSDIFFRYLQSSREKK